MISYYCWFYQARQLEEVTRVGLIGVVGWMIDYGGLQIMNLFRNYEEEFIVAIQSINKKIDNIALATSQKKELAFNDIRADLTECQKHIKLMQTEIASMSPDKKFDYLRKVRQYKKDFDTSRKSLFKSEDNYALEKNKEMLIGAELDESDNHKSKFIRQGEMLSDTTYKLKDGVRVMHQTLEISEDVGGQLYDHTGRLISNRKKLGGMREDLSKSGKLIKTMMNRIRKNKFILFSILGVIFLVVIILMGIHFSKNNSTSSTTQ